MPNDSHYPAGAPEGKGGQFAPKSNFFKSSIQENREEKERAVDFIPKKTASGKPRKYFSDMSEEEKGNLLKEYMGVNSDFFFQSKELEKKYRTDLINTRERDFKRATWINDEFNAQMKNGDKKAGKKAVLLIGLPGSGKSTLAKPLMKKLGAFVVDADEFKKRIPEFDDDHRMVSAVHKESVDLADTFLNGLAEVGYNMVIGKVGGDYESIKYTLDKLQDKGYEIEIVLNDVPLEETLRRSIERFKNKETDRLVPFSVAATADKNVFDTFDKAMGHPAVTNGKVYNNDVPKGEEPILLHEFTKSSKK